MERIFSFLGKLFLGTILLILVLGIGYFVGTHKNLNRLTPAETVITSQTQAKPSSPPTITLRPSESVKKKTITAGLSDSTAFHTYTLEIPQGWNDMRETVPSVSDKLTLQKNSYTLTIYQAAFGGNGCTYKGQAATEMAQSFTDFIQITSVNGDFRRSWNEDLARPTIIYTICQKASDNTYGSITKYGRITAEAHNPIDKAVLSEMDSIIASITQK